MSTSKKPGLRQSVRSLCDQYEQGNKKPLEDLVRAWKKIKELPPEDKRSFFQLGGYHGEPFDYRPAVDALSNTDWYLYWGGYCHHGNVLFPVWHRVYVYKLEKALQSFEPDVMMAYWDETSKETQEKGIPWILTNESFMLDGEEIENPLKSFRLPVAVTDNLRGDDDVYAKPKGYETVRYPLSGLVGTEKARQETAEHNAKYPDHTKNTELLNENVRAWLKGSPVTTGDPNPTKNGVLGKYRNCLDAPNYTVFSNTTSAGQWNLTISGDPIVPLESPHNSIHLSVGGFDLPGQGQSGQVAGANGDMGENNTAGLDPIFFFHHCYVDRMFWLWQQRNKCEDGTPCTEKLEIIPGYYGTSSSDSQGPTPELAPNTPLELGGRKSSDGQVVSGTPLRPFLKDEMGHYYVGEDCVNIETQMDYAYPPITEEERPRTAKKGAAPQKKLMVTGINRSLFQGSFVLEAYANVNGERHFLGHEAVLSRGNVARCANCLTHIEVAAAFPLNGVSEKLLSADAASNDDVTYNINIHHRGSEQHPVQALAFSDRKKGELRGKDLPEKLNYNIKVVD